MVGGSVFLGETRPTKSSLAQSLGRNFPSMWSTYHPKQSLNAQQISVPGRQLCLHGKCVLQVTPSFLVFLLGHEVAHHAQSVRNGQCNVQTCPPSGSFIRIARVVLVDQVHERWLMEKRKHAIEVLEVVFDEGERFVLGRQRLEDSARKDVAEHCRLPVYPLIVVDCGA